MKKITVLFLALVMVMALAACGGGNSEPAAANDAPAAPAAPADAPTGAVAPPEGDATGEPTGEPVAELYPADGFDKTLDGYKAYAEEALRQDEHAPADIVEMTIETIKAATDGNDDAFAMLIHQGLILSYDEFIAG